MREFVRVLKPGGIGYFQMAEHTRNPVKRSLVKHPSVEDLLWLLRHQSRQPFQVHGRFLDEIAAGLGSAGAGVVGVETYTHRETFWLDHKIALGKRFWYGVTALGGIATSTA